MKTSLDITVLIPTHNEETNIERCLKSVIDWAQEVIVLDSSSDKTAEIAKKLGATVVRYQQDEQYPFRGVQKAINLASDSAKTTWILRLDADEEVTPGLRAELEKVTNSSESKAAYGVPRRQYFWGGFLKGGDWAYDRLIRLYKKGTAEYAGGAVVHEQFTVTGDVGELQAPLNHYSHPNLKIAIQKFNTYTDVEIDLLRLSRSAALQKMLFIPPYVFLRWMFWHHGWKDGYRGIVAGIMRAWYDFILYAKYIERKKQ